MNLFPLVSVIMSVFNTEEAHLREAIESILNQSYKNIEFIIINDASENNSLEIIRSYNKDSRIRLINNDKNIGLTKSLNIGLKIAKGVYIARMDSDDISFPDRICKQVDYMQRNLKVAAVGTLAQTFGMASEIFGITENNSRITRVRLLFRNSSILHPTAFIRKSFLDQYNIQYDEGLRNAQDYQLWIDILRYGEIHCINEVYLWYRLHSSQTGHQSPITQIKCSELIQDKQLCLLSAENITDVEKEIHHSMVKPELYFSVKKNIQYLKKLLSMNSNLKLYDTKILKKEILSLWINKGINRFIVYKKIDVLCTLYLFQIFYPSNFLYYLRYYVIKIYCLKRIKRLKERKINACHKID